MLLECKDDDYGFVLSKFSDPDKPWLMIVKKRRRGYGRSHMSYNKRISSQKFITYLGTKKDTNIDMPWCDKFVLIGSKIAGVDPAAWRMLRSVDASR